MQKQPIVRRAAIIAAVLATVVYLGYRAIFTLNLSSFYATFASTTLWCAELYGCFLMFLYFFQIWHLDEPEERSATPGKSVDVYIPTYNEPPDLLRGTISAAIALDYPHETYVLDDGNRPEVAELAEELGARYINRPSNLHAKAGNLNHAMEITKGEFVIIFDADHIARRDFITQLVGHFDDERMGFVQTPHSFYNFDNFHGRLSYRRKNYWEEGELFYNVIQPGKNYWNAVSFCGSAAMFRRSALEDVGLVATETITEDMHTGLRLHARGWKSLFVNKRLVTGQAATDVSTFNTQRLRWGEGNLGIFAFDNPLTMKGLTFAQRICYLGSMLSWTTGLQKLQLYVAPILMLLTGVPPVAELSWMLAAITIAYMLTIWTAVTVTSNGHGNLIGTELTHMASFWTQIQSTYRAVFKRRKTKFVVTSKRGRQTNRIRKFIAPQVLYMTGCAIAITWATTRYAIGLSNDLSGLVVGSILLLIQAAFAWEVIRRALRSKNDTDENWRHPCAMSVRYRYNSDNGTVLEGSGVTCDLNETGVGFHAFEEIPSGATIELQLSAMGITTSVEACVRNSTRALNTQSRRDGSANSWRYGCQFVKPGTESLAAIWRLGSDYATARLYDRFERRKRGDCDTSIETQLVTLAEGAPRVNLPVTLERGDSGSISTVTEKVTRDGFIALLPASNSHIDNSSVSLATPLGTISGRVTLQSTRTVVLGCTELAIAEYRFSKMFGESRSVWLSVCGTSGERSVEEVVSLTPDERKLPVFRPAMLVGCITVVVALAACGIMLGVNRDQLLLTQLSQPGAVLTDAGNERLDQLIASLTDKPTANEMQIMKLREILRASGDLTRLKKIDNVLMQRNAETFSAKLFQAQGYAGAKRYAEAQPLFEMLLAEKKQARDAQELGQLFLSSARNAANLGDHVRAVELFLQVPLASRGSNVLRMELAGLLCTVGRSEEAVAEALKTKRRSPSEELQLASFMAANRQFAEAAIKCEEIVDRLGDCEVDTAYTGALSLLADCAQADNDFALTRRTLQKLIPYSPSDPALRRRLAFATLYDRDGPAAAQLFSTLLQSDPTDSSLAIAYAQAALLCKSIDARSRRLLISTAERMPLEECNNEGLRALAGALAKFSIDAPQPRLLRELVRRNPTEEQFRLQLVDVLEANGQHARAKQHLDYLLGRDKRPMVYVSRSED
ncbi:MAG: hypothetical protein Aurels2KO_37010 [Aureliella sp.]